jgi:uncharacterized protein YukE
MESTNKRMDDLTGEVQDLKNRMQFSQGHINEFKQENGKMTAICKSLREDISSVCEYMTMTVIRLSRGTIKAEQHYCRRNCRISTWDLHPIWQAHCPPSFPKAWKGWESQANGFVALTPLRTHTHQRINGLLNVCFIFSCFVCSFPYYVDLWEATQERAENSS